MHIDFASYDELRCLHLALCEAKFHREPDRWEVQASPFVASVAHKVYDALIEFAPTQRKREEWEEFRTVDTDSAAYHALRQVIEAGFPNHNFRTSEERDRFCHYFVAPFRISPRLLSELLDSQS